MVVQVWDVNNYNTINNIDFGEKVIFFKFGAEWCKPCIELEKILDDIQDILVYNISIDNNDFETFFEENGIYSIPDTFVKYKNNNTRFQGIKTEAELNLLIDNLKKQ